MSEKKKHVPPDASFYQSIKDSDICTWMEPLVDKGSYCLRFGDGHFEAILPAMAYKTPWSYVKVHEELNCTLQTSVLFNVVFKGLGKEWVPERCQNCWKVTVYLDTLLQLFTLERLQMQQKKFQCKCGIEVRPTVGRLYGGYFYNTTLEIGQECYAAVRKMVDEEPELGPDIKVVLKRGCTEFEFLAGDSSKWEVSPEQRHVEDLVFRMVHSGANYCAQPDHVRRHVHRRWIEYAYAMGDETYLLFTGGKPIAPDYVEYHEGDPREDKGATGAETGTESVPAKKKRSKKSASHKRKE